MLTPPGSGTISVDQLAAVARIEVSGISFNWHRPYAQEQPFQAVGSAALICLPEPFRSQQKGGCLYLLTAYHVVRNATGIWAVFANMSGQSFDSTLVGACPEIDIAILRVDKVPEKIQDKLRPFRLGNSDELRPQQSVVAAGFPQAQNTVKTVQGVVSGRQNGSIQIDASVNQGNSGGPLLDTKSGLIVGIITSGERDAVGMNYATPIRQVQVRLEKLLTGFARLPSLNIETSRATPALLQSLGLKDRVGSFVRQVHPSSTCFSAGMRRGDVLLSLRPHNGSKILPIGLDNSVNVVWWPSPVTLETIRSRLLIGSKIDIEYWSVDEQKVFMKTIVLQENLNAVRLYFEEFETPDYETMGGLVVMQLTLNHINFGAESGKRRGLWSRMFTYLQQQTDRLAEPILVITDVLPTSSLRKLLNKTIAPTDIIVAVNDVAVKTLADYRAALRKPLTRGGQDYIVWQTRDGMKTALSQTKAIEEHRYWKENMSSQSRLRKPASAKDTRVVMSAKRDNQYLPEAKIDKKISHQMKLSALLQEPQYRNR